MKGAHRYPRAARLKRRSLIRALFSREAGVARISAGSLTLRFRIVPSEESGTREPVQIGFAPGRRKTAVIRNRLRRLLREQYRTHQEPLRSLLSDSGRTLTVMALYRGTDDGEAISRDMPAVLARLAEQIEVGGRTVRE